MWLCVSRQRRQNSVWFRRPAAVWWVFIRGCQEFTGHVIDESHDIVLGMVSVLLFLRVIHSQLLCIIYCNHCYASWSIALVYAVLRARYYKTTSFRALHQ
jgi:hypothetical protein